MSRARVLLADDHVLIQEGLRKILEPHYEVVGTVGDGRSLIEAALRFKPDLIVLDVSMPLLGGIEAGRQVRGRLRRTKLLYLSIHTNPAYLQEALRAGAMGYLLKSSTRREILDAVETVLAGRRFISPGIVAADFDVSKWKPGNVETARQTLTSRERQVLQLLADGHTAKQVSLALSVSVKTVTFHRQNAKRKLGVKKTVELIKRAIDDGLV